MNNMICQIAAMQNTGSFLLQMTMYERNSASKSSQEAALPLLRLR